MSRIIPDKGFKVMDVKFFDFTSVEFQKALNEFNEDEIKFIKIYNSGTGAGMLAEFIKELHHPIIGDLYDNQQRKEIVIGYRFHDGCLINSIRENPIGRKQRMDNVSMMCKYNSGYDLDWAIKLVDRSVIALEKYLLSLLEDQCFRIMKLNGYVLIKIDLRYPKIPIVMEINEVGDEPCLIF